MVIDITILIGKTVTTDTIDTIGAIGAFVTIVAIDTFDAIPAIDTIGHFLATDATLRFAQKPTTERTRIFVTIVIHGTILLIGGGLIIDPTGFTDKAEAILTTHTILAIGAIVTIETIDTIHAIHRIGAILTTDAPLRIPTILTGRTCPTIQTIETIVTMGYIDTILTIVIHGTIPLKDRGVIVDPTDTIGQADTIPTTGAGGATLATRATNAILATVTTIALPTIDTAGATVAFLAIHAVDATFTKGTIAIHGTTPTKGPYWLNSRFEGYSPPRIGGTQNRAPRPTPRSRGRTVQPIQSHHGSNSQTT